MLCSPRFCVRVLFISKGKPRGDEPDANRRTVGAECCAAGRCGRRTGGQECPARPAEVVREEGCDDSDARRREAAYGDLHATRGEWATSLPDEAHALRGFE